MVSAITLYMMHAVDLEKCHVHPTLNCANRLFNWFADNGGYHIEHSLYPTLHPAFLLRQPAAKKRAWIDLLALTERLDRPNRPA